MTQREYTVLARCLSDTRRELDKKSLRTVDIVISRIAEALQNDNMYFNKDIFIERSTSDDLFDKNMLPNAIGNLLKSKQVILKDLLKEEGVPVKE